MSGVSFPGGGVPGARFPARWGASCGVGVRGPVGPRAIIRLMTVRLKPDTTPGYDGLLPRRRSSPRMIASAISFFDLRRCRL